MFDIIVVGGGPCGLTSAIYGKCAGKSVLVLEKLMYGGQIINTPSIENFPLALHMSGASFATKIYEQAKELGAVIKFEEVLKINNFDDYKEVVTNKETYRGKTVIIATGKVNRKLDLPREDRLVGKGVSYCATCDGNFYKGKNVAVVGGGNTALEDALYLSKICNKVYLIHRREEFRGEDKSVTLLKSTKNVTLVLNSSVVSLNGEEKLDSIEIMNTNGSKKEIEVDGLFIAIGQVPVNDNFKDLVDIDEDGYIVANGSLTNVPGVFVAGDARKKEVYQLVTAVSDGAIASLDAIKYINSL